MKRIFVILAIIAGLLFSSAALPAAESWGREERAPSGTATIGVTRTAIGTGCAWGEGTLKYNGESYSFKVLQNVRGTVINLEAVPKGAERGNKGSGKSSTWK